MVTAITNITPPVTKCKHKTFDAKEAALLHSLCLGKLLGW